MAKLHVEIENHDKCTIISELKEEVNALWYHQNALEIAIKVVENASDEDIERAKKAVAWLDRKSRVPDPCFFWTLNVVLPYEGMKVCIKYII